MTVVVGLGRVGAANEVARAHWWVDFRLGKVWPQLATRLERAVIADSIAARKPRMEISTMRNRALFRPWLTAAIGVFVLQGVSGMAVADPPESQTPRAVADRRDVHSFGNPHQIRVKDVALELVVDPDKREWKSVATLTIERQPKCPPDARLILDTREMQVDAVSDVSKADAVSLPFQMGPSKPILGTPLLIDLTPETTKIRIAYQVSAKATALQWVDKEGTATKSHGFLYTQSEAIHVRSWIPLQDSPAVRVTYSATVRTPAGMTAVMSADRVKAKGGVFEFRMPQAIAPYLIALAVGEIDFRAIGDREGVFAEPPVVEKARAEFADTGSMVRSAEMLCGPYHWGRYDLLVLPPSFPYGGMENAKLTFATPTVIVGDKSLVALIAHELAHSWSGNLVTNATWRDFWLNEGFTTYLERRIVEDVFGPDRAAMEWVLARGELNAELRRLGPKDQILHIDLKGRDPDDGMTRIAYEKGALFLAALEKQVGRPAFDKFLKSYFNHFAFQSITTSDFEAFLRDQLFSKDPKVAEPVDVHAWLYNPGLPADAPAFHAAKFDAVDAQTREWFSAKIKASEMNVKGYSTFEWLRFLEQLPPQLPTERMAELDAAFHLTDQPNSEIAEQWLKKAIRSGYKPAEPALERFLTTIGRRKYLVPLYTELAKTKAGKARARVIYAKARPGYHPIAVESIDALVGVP
jgi:leukotriene-A4 hydrolase